MPPSPPRRRHQGFTLIEMLVVVAIIAALAGILIPSYRASLMQGDKSAALAQATSVKTALDSYLAAHPELTTAALVPLSCTTGKTLNVASPYVSEGNQGNRPGFTTPDSRVTGCVVTAATDRTVQVVATYSGGSVTLSSTGQASYGN